MRSSHIRRVLMSSLLATAVMAPITAAHSQACTPAQTASYRVTYNAVWSSTTHPTSFPGNAHFSGLVGGTHNAAIHLWQEGELASTGIKRVAETGSKTVLINEVNAAIGAGDAFSVISGGSIGVSPGSANATFAIDQGYPLASVVTMIAPSPDWFVGTDSTQLFRNGNWVAQTTESIYPYDAGTDSGATYTSSNQATNPPVGIFEIGGAPFLNGGVVASTLR